MATPVELSWRFGEGKFHFGGGKLGVPLQMPFLSSSIFHNEKLSAFFHKLATHFKFLKIFKKNSGKNLNKI